MIYIQISCPYFKRLLCVYTLFYMPILYGTHTIYVDIKYFITQNRFMIDN